MSRPEHIAPPEIFYNETEAVKYTSSSRMIEIQETLTERAIELLNLPPIEQGGKKLLLDIGCGSGLSGEVLDKYGHMWLGVDISPHMLAIAKQREVNGDIFLADMGDGMFFRPGTFDGAISISALQWLCNADKNYHIPKKRMMKFFQSLYNCLSRGTRAVFQFYPENPQQMELITTCSMKCGFTGGLVIDFPNSTRAKKYFLVLFCGSSINNQLPEPKGLDVKDEEEGHIQYSDRGNMKKKKKEREPIKSRNWVLKKKESQRRKGLQVRPDTKYTGRSRSKRTIV